MEVLKWWNGLQFGNLTVRWITGKVSTPLEGGLLDKQNLIAELKTYKLVDQYLFHTEAALKVLKFMEAKEVAL